MDTKERIIEAYLKLGKTKGADNVSLSDIAGEVGIRKASIYAHFESGASIRQAVLDRGLERMKAVQPTVDFKAKDPGTLLYAFAESLASAFAEPEVSCLWTVFCQLRYSDKAFSDACDQIEKMVEARVRVAIEFCVQKGWFDVPDTDGASSFFCARLLPNVTKAALGMNSAFDGIEDLIDDSVELFS